MRTAIKVFGAVVLVPLACLGAAALKAIYQYVRNGTR